jgi:uncharacterized repeat protein (TIGR03806 family)
MTLKSFAKYLSLFLSTVIIIQSCETTKEPINIDIDFSKVPYKSISEYGFFVGKLSDLNPNDRVLIYEPAATLFTDYAHKSRFIWMPEGVNAKINFEDTTGTIDFPDKTIIAKNFYYPEDFRKPEGKRRVMETRLMVKDNGKWSSYPYVWNKEQTEAIYKVSGGEYELSWIDEKGDKKDINYVVPNKNQCKSCHNQNEEMVPIGVKVKHLNYDFNYSSETKNQLAKWVEVGYLESFENTLIANHALLVNYNDPHQNLDNKARSYLDINCAHCHNPSGPASTSGLFLNIEHNDAHKLGVFKTPVAAGFGSGNHTFDIVPGKADESIMVYRMESNDVGAAMPEIGRVMTHVEGVQLIRDWINSLEGERPEQVIEKRYL